MLIIRYRFLTEKFDAIFGIKTGSRSPNKHHVTFFSGTEIYHIIFIKDKMINGLQNIARRILKLQLQLVVIRCKRSNLKIAWLSRHKPAV